MDRTLGMRFTIIAPLRTGQDDSGRLEGGALTNSRPWRPIPGRRGGAALMRPDSVTSYLQVR